MLGILVLLLSLSGVRCAVQSVPELEKVMYKMIQGYPCVRLINLYRETGCANPGRDKVVAPIHKLTTLDIQSAQPVIVILPYRLFHVFLEKTSIEPAFASKVAGVIVEFEPNANVTATEALLSPDDIFPQAEFAPYAQKTYQWNPSGSGVLHKRYNFPVYLLTEESTEVLQQVMASDKAGGGKHPLYVAEFDVVMQTTTRRTHTSESCLKEQACLPLGGYSVWSALPFVDTSASSEGKPLVLVMAAMDSASFFRDSTPGADSPISGLISLLAAVDALSKLNDFSETTRQLVFLVCTGEAWGYLGSRRFIHELESGGESVAGLNKSSIYQILEVGSVGRTINKTFYAHTQTKQLSAVHEILAALETSAKSLGISLKSANDNNPGVPPSSLMPFLQKNSSTPGVVLEDFDDGFTNSYYHSHLDTAKNVYHDDIVAASGILARALYQLAKSDSTISPSDLGAITVNSSLVQELVTCLLTTDPGLQCSLVKSLMSPFNSVANHYVGVFLGDPASPPPQDIVDDTSRFVWNFLADRTKTKTSESGTQCTGSCKDPSQVCVGATSQHKGSCVVSNTRYVPAYSTRLEYKSNGWKLLPVVPEDLLNSVDPVWTESYWKTISLRVYLQDSLFVDRLILLTGCLVTLVSFIAILATRAVFRKRLKSA